MHFTNGAVALWCLSVGAAAFSPSAFTSSPSAFVSRSSSASNNGVVASRHAAGCFCPACVSGAHPTGCACGACSSSRTHPASCGCVACGARSGTALFADVSDSAEAEVPAEVEAMDGIGSDEEAHNAERPARSSLQKKTKREPRGTAVNDLEIGSMVTGKVRSITSYGAFIDIGAQTDGLLHISQLAAGFVNNVSDILKDGQEVEVRIVSVDADKNQVALSMMSEEEAASSQQQQSRPQRQGNNRRDDNAALAALSKAGWDSSAFIEGTVVSTVDFGCFVRLDTSLLNSECTGELDGLVHISALSNQRVSTVTDVVNVDDKVQIRVKSIDKNKVSLTMLSVAEEEAKSEARGGDRGGPAAFEGAKDWKESLAKLQADAPSFSNRPLVEDRR